MTWFTPSSATAYESTDCLYEGWPLGWNWTERGVGHLRVSVGALELVGNVALGEERAGLRVEDGALADTAV